MVWLEPWQAARAILERSSRNIIVQPIQKNAEGETMDHEEAVSEPEAAVPIPTPPGIWRLGFECQHAKALVMRFATRADRKIKGAERLSQYYRNHGNPNYGGMAGLISSSRKRRFRGKPDPTELVDSKNPWGSLAKAWGDTEPAEAWETNEAAEAWEASEPAADWERRTEGISDLHKKTIYNLFTNMLHCLAFYRETLYWNWIALSTSTAIGIPTTASIPIEIKRHGIRCF